MAKKDRRRRKRRNPRSREPGFKQTDKNIHRVNLDEIPKWKLFFDKHRLVIIQVGLIALVGLIIGLVVFIFFL